MGPFRPHRERWFAFGAFTALTLLLTYPLPVHPASASLGSDPDVHTFTWTLGWDVHAFLRRPWSVFDANIFFPYDGTLAFSENLLGSAVVAAPVIWLTGNYVLAMNVVAIVSVVLCGLGVYVLARQLGLSPGAAFVGGVVFAFSPARFFRFQQIHLTAIQWMPFALASLHAYVANGRARDVRLAIAFLTLQAFTSLHGAVFLALAIAVLLACHVLAGEPIALIRRARHVGLPGTALLVPTVLLAVPYLNVQREMGFVRTLENWIPTPASFIASPTHVHTWLMAQIFDGTTNDRASAFLFPGVLPLILAAFAIAAVRKRAERRIVVVYAAITVLGLVLSVGPPLSVWPYVYWLPGFNFIRIPSRFFLLTVFGIAVLAAVGCDHVVGRLVRHRRDLAIAVSVLLVCEFAAVPLPLTPFTVEFDPVDRWLASQPAPVAIAEVPVGPTTRSHSTYMLHSMVHWHKTVHGHSSLLPPLHEELYAALRNFPDDASLEMLSRVGVTHVVVHAAMYPPEAWDTVERALSRHASRLELLHGDPSGRVYRLR